MFQIRCPWPNDLERLFLDGGPEEELLALEQRLCNAGPTCNDGARAATTARPASVHKHKS